MSNNVVANTNTPLDGAIFDALTLLFGAVGITSLCLAFFAIWLSWQFYKESRKQSDRVSDEVTSIASTVSAVQVHIEKIVEKTVDNLIHTQSDYTEETLEEALDGLDDLRSKISELSGIAAQSDESLVADLKAMVMTQEKKIEDIARTSRESHLRNLLGTPQAKAVSSEKSIKDMGENFEKGVIVLRISRAVQIATGTIKFSANLK